VVVTLFNQHHETLTQAINAIATRDFWTIYPEVPSGKIYGETAKEDGLKAFETRRNRSFLLDQPHSEGVVGNEISPYGITMNIDYPRVDCGQLLDAMHKQLPTWRDAGIEVRTGICLEILSRLNKASFEIGQSTMFTTGQSFVMAFQSGGPHAQDRGLEAVAQAYLSMTQIPSTAKWTKPQGKHQPLVVKKTYTVTPKGVSAVIACATFPTWNSYPALFASLVTGNPVIVKPHPNAILPLAVTVQIAQQVLKEQGFPPCLVSLAADEIEAPITSELAANKKVKIVDYTGSTPYGQWLELNAPQAQVYTEKSGVNSVVIDSCDNFKGMINNLTFSVCLYSGQMCTTPQNIYIPKQGIQTDEGHLTFNEVAAALAQGIANLLCDTRRANDTLGAIQSTATLARLEGAKVLGKVILADQAYHHQTYPQATMRSPLILEIEADQKQHYMQELFGPVILLIASQSTEHSIELATESAMLCGAITWAVYSTDESVLMRTESASLDAGVALSCNLTGGLFVNQAAAFSDFHATGANPAANASLTTAHFVTGRFNVVQSRRHQSYCNGN
jgi:phenylacetic acid degradation protein paaN